MSGARITHTPQQLRLLGAARLYRKCAQYCDTAARQGAAVDGRRLLQLALDAARLLGLRDTLSEKLLNKEIDHDRV